MKLIIALIVVVMFALTGCAGWDRKAVASYELAGVVPSNFCKTSEQLCKSNAFPDQGKCPKVREICNKSRTSYILVGNILILTKNTTDDVQKNKLKEDYYLRLSEFTKLSYEIILLGAEFGLIK